jgi:hypothetical protein
MNKTILSEALKQRKAKSFDTNGFIQKPTKGLDSPDLGAKTVVVMGEGVKEETLMTHTGGRKSSTDDLSPSKQELEVKGHDVPKVKQVAVEDLDLDEPNDRDEGPREVGGNYDDDVFDENTFEKMKNRKPKSIYERMQLNLGKKRNK